MLHQSMAVSGSSDAENRHAPRDPRRTRHLVLPPPGFVAGKGTQARHSTAQPGAAQHSTAQQCSTKRGKAQTARRNTTQHNTAQHGTSQHITSHLGTFWTNVCKDGEPHDGTTLKTVRTTHRALCEGVDVAISPGTRGSWIVAGGVRLRHLYRGLIWSQGASHIAIVSQSCLSPPPLQRLLMAPNDLPLGFLGGFKQGFS